MKGIAHHLDNVRSKPHHVRRQVAFIAAAVITGAITVAWLGASLYTGAFALKGSNFAQETGAEAPAPASGTTGSSGVAGAAASLNDTSGPARIQVVNTGSTDPSPAPSDSGSQTVIPY